MDLSIVKLATDSEGETFTGAMIHVVRTRFHRRRQRLQQCGTCNARRRIRGMGRREARCQSATNHYISKKLIQKAAVARKALALADLRGSRERTKTTVRRANCCERRCWAFFQPRQ